MIIVESSRSTDKSSQDSSKTMNAKSAIRLLSMTTNLTLIFVQDAIYGRKHTQLAQTKLAVTAIKQDLNDHYKNRKNKGTPTRRVQP